MAGADEIREFSRVLLKADETKKGKVVRAYTKESTGKKKQQMRTYDVKWDEVYCSLWSLGRGCACSG
jgi:hypothetical protein